MKSNDSECIKKHAYLVRLVFVVIMAFFSLRGNAYSSESVKKHFDYTINVFRESVFAVRSDESLRIVVLDSKDGKPVKDADICTSLISEQNDEISRTRGKTDQYGMVSLIINTGLRPGKAFLLISAVKGDVKQEFRDSVILSEKEILESDIFILNSDKCRYVVCRMRMLAGLFYSPVRGRKISVFLFDSAGKILFSDCGTTDEGGFSVVKFPVLPEMLKGKYMLSMSCGGLVEKKRFMITDLKAGLDARLSFDKGAFCVGEAVTGKIRVNLPDGRPVKDAKIKLNIRSIEKNASDLMELDRTTDENGIYLFRFTVPDIPGLEKGERIGLSFEAEIAKGKQSGEVRGIVPVYLKPYFISLIPERKRLKKGLSNKISFLSVNFEYSPYRLDTEITSPLKMKIDSPCITFEVKPGDSDFMIFELNGKDGTHSDFRREIKIPVEKNPSSILIRPDRVLYGKGDEICIELFSTEKTGVVYLDLAGNGRVFKSDIMDLEDGYSRKVIKADDASIGLVEIRAYLVKENEVLTDEESIFIYPLQGLKISMNLNKWTFVPGEEMPFFVKVETSDGKPVDTYLDFGIEKERIGSSVSWNNNLSMDDSIFRHNGNEFSDLSKSIVKSIFSGLIGNDEIRQALAKALFLEIGSKKDYDINKKHCGEKAKPDSEKTDTADTSANDTGRDSYGLDSNETDLPSGFYKDDFPGELYFFIPYIKTGKGGEFRKEVGLPEENFDGFVFSTVLSAKNTVSSKIKVARDYSLDTPLFGRIITQNDKISVPFKLVNYLKENMNMDVFLRESLWFKQQTKNNRIMLPGYQDGSVFFDIDVEQDETDSSLSREMILSLKKGDDYKEVEGEVYVLPEAVEDNGVKSGFLDSEVMESIEFPSTAKKAGMKVNIELFNSLLPFFKRNLEKIREEEPVVLNSLVSRMLLTTLVVEMSDKSGINCLADYKNELLKDMLYLRCYESHRGGFSQLIGEESSDVRNTACALMAVSSINRYFPSYDDLMERNMKWLFHQRKDDGSWPSDNITGLSDVTVTAVVLWALLECGATHAELKKSTEFIKKHAVDIKDPYLAALSGNIFRLLDDSCKEYKHLTKLVQQQHSLLYEKNCISPISLYSGASAWIEKLALSVTALPASSLPYEQKKRLSMLLLSGNNKSSYFSMSPFATYMASKALYSLYEKGFGTGEITVSAGESKPLSIKVGSDDIGICRKINLTDQLKKNKLEVIIKPWVNFPVFYRIIYQFFNAYENEDKENGKITVKTVFNSCKIRRTEVLEGKISSTFNENCGIAAISQPVPWGFKIDRDYMDRQKREGQIIDYSVKNQDLTIFKKFTGKELNQKFALISLYPCKVSVRPAKVWSLLNPEKRGISSFIKLTVEP